MADTEYKCPACGGGLAFDSKSQNLKCPYCDSEYSVDAFESGAANGEEEKNETGSMDWDVKPGQEWDSAELDQMNVYHCASCGGETVVDENTTASSCPYCGNPIVLKGKLEGMLKPDYIIPFKLGKKEAKEKLKEHVNSKKLVPALFKEENHIDEIKGVYIPFWLFDAEVDADIEYRGERVRSWSDSDYEYVETKHFSIERAGHVAFDHVPVDGSEKMPDDLMESIEPFDFSEAREFQKAYLAGYLADKYDVDADASIEAANNRIRRSTENAFRDTIDTYTAVHPVNTNVDMENGKAKYALYPVWLLNTSWQDRTYTFAMNGQTGKFVGDLPLDKGAYWRKFAFLGAAITAGAAAIALIADYLFI